MDNLNKVTGELGMKINVKKIKVMCISWKENKKLKIYDDGQKVELFQICILHKRYLEQNWGCRESVYGEKILFTGKWIWN